MELFGEAVAMSTAIWLLLALALALSFELVNGFHDTANAVATVIYTNSLKPTTAVVWSGCWNLLGVLVSSGAVAYGIVNLLPVELVLNIGSAKGMAMVLSLLLSAILWNLGTWYFGIPASSSHTLIGSIMGVGLAHSLMNGGFLSEGVNWSKAKEILMSLLFSPMIGFGLAALLLLLSRKFIKNVELYKSPEGKAPPTWIRSILIFTCTGVSFAHGSNDGGKGMGLLMLILIGVLPASFALNEGTSAQDLNKLLMNSNLATSKLEQIVPPDAPKIMTAGVGGASDAAAPNVQMSTEEAETELSRFLRPNATSTALTIPAVVALSRDIQERLVKRKQLSEVPKDERKKLRSDFYLSDESLGKLQKQGILSDSSAIAAIKNYRADLSNATRFIPTWVRIAVALALGIGTMVGWRRVVVTVGEKIGKDHLTYAQGASAELVAMTTIATADVMGLPVSTTHVLTSGVAGTMAANGSGVQMATVKTMLLAWVLTLPVTVFLGATLFGGGLYALSQLGLN